MDCNSFKWRPLKPLSLKHASWLSANVWESAEVRGNYDEDGEERGKERCRRRRVGGRREKAREREIARASLPIPLLAQLPSCMRRCSGEQVAPSEGDTRAAKINRRWEDTRPRGIVCHPFLLSGLEPLESFHSSAPCAVFFLFLLFFFPPLRGVHRQSRGESDEEPLSRCSSSRWRNYRRTHSSQSYLSRGLGVCRANYIQIGFGLSRGERDLGEDNFPLLLRGKHWTHHLRKVELRWHPNVCLAPHSLILGEDLSAYLCASLGASLHLSAWNCHPSPIPNEMLRACSSPPSQTTHCDLLSCLHFQPSAVAVPFLNVVWPP